MPFDLYVSLKNVDECFVHMLFNVYRYFGYRLNFVCDFFFIEQKSFAFSSISPCVSLGTFNLVWAEENKLDKALAFNSKKFRIKSHYFL